MGALLLAASVMATTPAWANDKQDFETCDGRQHPGKQDDGMRGMVGRRMWSFPGLLGDSVAQACTRALASPRLLPTQTLRRAHLLRARAAASLAKGNAAEALTDIDAAEAAAGSLKSDPFYQRSMAISLDLLRAIALVQTGDTTRASALATSAMAARPYALEVQEVGGAILQAGRPIGAPPASVSGQAKLGPLGLAAMIDRESEIGNHAAVLALRPALALTWPKARLAPFALAAPSPDMAQLVSAMGASFDIAYARAATGDVAGARRDLAEIRDRVAAARPEAKAAEGLVTPDLGALLDKYVAVHARRVDARIAIAEGRPGDAIATLVAEPMPKDGTTLDLLIALRGAMPGDKAGMVPDPAPFAVEWGKKRRELLLGSVSEVMLAPETPRSVIDYSRARPNILGALVAGALTMGTSLLGGISRTDGFRSTSNPDGTVKVEFIGNTPSAALVREMTLLRAAEVTRAAGKSAFVIVERRDFSRSMVMSRNGIQESSTPTGFKTELTIRYVDAGVNPIQSLDALGVIDALGPLYYEEKAAPART